MPLDGLDIISQQLAIDGIRGGAGQEVCSWPRSNRLAGRHQRIVIVPSAASCALPTSTLKRADRPLASVPPSSARHNRGSHA